MDKRYQIFVSSTFSDLQEERRKVFEAIMKMDHTPAGMELFPAFDEDQLQFIKKVIDDSDYYLLIVGGRYGSISTEGISFTEKEYDYALSSGKKIMAFLHRDPSQIPAGKSELEPEARGKLEAFRSKVRTGRLVKEWETAEDLQSSVVLSLINTIKAYPEIGWVRGDKAGDPEQLEKLLLELNEVRAENSKLAQASSKQTSLEPLVDNLASFEESFTVLYDYNGQVQELKKTWCEYMGMIGPLLMSEPDDGEVRKTIEHSLRRNTNFDRTIFLHSDGLQTIKTQFVAHRFIELIRPNGAEASHLWRWKLTEKGLVFMVSQRAIRSSLGNQDPN